MKLCTQSPVDFKLKRTPTYKRSKCRWVSYVLSTGYKSNDGHEVLTITTQINTEQDMSMSGVTRQSGLTKPNVRTGSNREWTFHTKKGAEIVSEDGLPLDTVPDGSSVSVRYTPVIKDDVIHLALECVVIHK